jgi:hypothetical protein
MAEQQDVLDESSEVKEEVTSMPNAARLPPTPGSGADSLLIAADL